MSEQDELLTEIVTIIMNDEPAYEQALKIRAKARGHYETQIIALQEIIQYLEQKRLDRPDREKIARMLYFNFEEYDEGTIAEVSWTTAPQARRDAWLDKADQVLARIPDIEKVECAFEDWDDTTLPHPVCHCLKREGVDCANVPDDVEACPDFVSKQDWLIEETKKQNTEQIDAMLVEARRTAKKQERIDIANQIRTILSENQTWATLEKALANFWQALKEEK